MLLRCFTNTTERKRIRIFLTVAWLYLAVWILLRYIQLNLWGLENEKAFKIINIQRETSGRTKHWCEVLLLSCVTERVSFTGMIFEVSEFQNVFILVFSWGNCSCPIWNVQKMKSYTFSPFLCQFSLMEVYIGREKLYYQFMSFVASNKRNNDNVYFE